MSTQSHSDGTLPEKTVEGNKLIVTAAISQLAHRGLSTVEQIYASDILKGVEVSIMGFTNPHSSNSYVGSILQIGSLTLTGTPSVLVGTPPVLVDSLAAATQHCMAHRPDNTSEDLYCLDISVDNPCGHAGCGTCSGSS